jgi:hypothetical protein
MNAHMVSNVVWSCGSLRLQHSALVNAVVKIAMADQAPLTGLTGQSLALTTWGLARMYTTDAGTGSGTSVTDPQEGSSGASVDHSVDHSAGDGQLFDQQAVFQHLAARTSVELQNGRLAAIDVVQLAYAFATVGPFGHVTVDSIGGLPAGPVDDSSLYRSFARHCMDHMHQYDTHMLASLAKSLFKVGWLEQALQDRLVEVLKEGKMQWLDVDRALVVRLLGACCHPYAKSRE